MIQQLVHRDVLLLMHMMQSIGITNLAIGIITCLLGQVAIPLSCFLKQVEDEKTCNACSLIGDCYGHRKPMLGHSENLNQWMLVSFLKLRGKCSYAVFSLNKNTVIYIITNAVLLTGSFWSKETGISVFLWMVTVSALFSLSVVDWNTQYIPLEMNIIIFICGLVHLFVDLSNWLEYVIGLIAVSGFLLLVNKVSVPLLRKRYGDDTIETAIGDGDIKLMAATGLLLGWKLNFLALGIGCVAGSVIHLILMKIKKGERQFALGPYLSLGVYITMICGEQLISWYLNMMGVKPL